MHFSSSTLFALFAAPLLASAAPLQMGKRAAADVLVFKFADVLEQLESAFYQQAIAKFNDPDFVSAGFASSQLPVELLKAIQSDEATHSVVLQDALKSFGQQPITNCQFNFNAALTDVSTMAVVARIVENIGVSAYLGGATLLTDPVLLAAAGSILTVEARHQTILNILSGVGTAIPSPFDIAFTPSEVLAVASPFISGCDLGIPSNIPLTVTNTGTVAPGTTVTFQASSLNGTLSTDKLFCQMLIGGAPMSIPLPLSQCVVPIGINGPVALWITSDGQPLLNNVRDRATTQIVAGPTVAFIDTVPQLIGQLARPGTSKVTPASSNSSSTTSTPVSVDASAATSTRTISPAEASSVIAGANTAASPAPSTVTMSSVSVISGTPGGPNMFTGKSADGKLTVLGWSTGK